MLLPEQDIRLAFTLAEVLITLGILGVVFSMTLPSLIQKHQEKVTITRLKKAYSIISQLYVQVTNDYGYPNEWEPLQSTDGTPDEIYTAYNIFKNYIKYIKICSTSDCLNQQYRLLNGQDDGNSSYRIAAYSLILPDGSFLKISDSPTDGNGVVLKDCNIVRGSTNALKSICREVYVDINGMQNPNTYGRDVFVFYWSKYGIIPAGGPDEPVSSVMDFEACLNSGYGCTAWVLINENMDYIHCDGLSWEGKKACK